jgi:hypothetical protein
MNKWLMRIWEAPQKLVAHLVARVAMTDNLEPITIGHDQIHIHLWNHQGGMSLSNHIFVNRKRFADFDMENFSISQRNHIFHEYGHTRQSHLLGPLYLIVIALPSLIWAGCFDEYRARHNISYYKLYTESWADKLGNVQREG